MTDSPIHKLESIFYPESIAIVGISPSRPDNFAMDFLDSLLEFGYKCPIYPVHPAGGQISGTKVYESLEDIPGKIDYVICAIPARSTPHLVEQCGRKGAKAIHFFTSGFSETGEEEGISLQKRVLEIAKTSGIRIIGPNCMGIYCPESRISFMPNFPREKGPICLIMQSGGYTADLINHIMYRGARFNKVVSYGNGIDLNESDFLEYFSADPESKVIGMYIEGVSNGNRFKDILSKASKKQTIVLLKAGATEGGARAVGSHTAALVGNNQIWNSLCKQYGIIRVRTLEEMGDVLVTASFLPGTIGKNVALIGGGGGPSVMMTDEFESRGFKVPALPLDVMKKISELTPLAGNMLTNPLDVAHIAPDTRVRVMNIIADWKGCDFIAGFLRIGFNRIGANKNRRQTWLGIADSFLKGAKTISKPFALVLEPGTVPEEVNEVFDLTRRLSSDGFPVYYSFASAAEAIRLYSLRHGVPFTK